MFNCLILKVLNQQIWFRLEVITGTFHLLVLFFFQPLVSGEGLRLGAYKRFDCIAFKWNLSEQFSENRMRENFNLSHKEVHCFCKTSVLADKRENMAEVPKKRKSSAYEVFPYYMLTQNAFRTSLNFFFFFCTDRKTPNNHDQKVVIFSNRIYLHWSLFSTIIVTSGVS